MPRNGSGNYSLPTNAWNPAINGVSATPADWQALINDVAAALQASVAADGQTPITGNLQMAGHLLTGAGAPSGTGMSLRWEQLTRGADIPSAASITIPLEGQFFAVTGSTPITGFDATIAGRLVYVKFDAGIVLTNSASFILPGGVNITTQADDIAVFLSVSIGVWKCVSYPRLLEDSITANTSAIAVAQWLGTPIGGYITPLTPPPTNDPLFRYILCTAGQTGAGGYNNGILTSETVTGTAPLLIATATVSLAGSPFNGQTIHLINTEGRFIGAGESEAFEDDMMQGHVHGTVLAGNKFYSATIPGAGGLDGASGYTGRFDLTTGSPADDSTNGTPRTGNHTQPRTHRLVHYRRIL
jgi:hypothetical protein